MLRTVGSSTPWFLVASVLALAACRSEPVERNAATPAPQNAARPAAPPALLPPEPRLDREALLLAVVRARSAAAAGQDDRAAQAPLDGARFELRIRFGCSPPSADEGDTAGLSFRYDAQARRVALRATPDLTLDHPAVAPLLAGQEVEAAEGFWIPHPWLLVAACPAGEVAPALWSGVGIAQFFAPTDARTERRDGRAYEARETLAEAWPSPEGQSWDLVLSGRLRSLAGGRAIRCAPAAGQMPLCVISAAFDQVVIENAASQEELARWGRG